MEKCGKKINSIIKIHFLCMFLQKGLYKFVARKIFVTSNFLHWRAIFADKISDLHFNTSPC